MDKINIGSQVYVYPMTVCIIGTMIDEKANFMALAWLSRVNTEPPLLGIAINKTHHTAQGIRNCGHFSVNFPGQDMVEKTDFTGIVSGMRTDKASLFEVFFGSTGAPMIKECPLSLECRFHDVIEFPENHFFIGEIVASYTEEKYMKGGKLDVLEMKPILLTMPDNGYWGIGNRIATAWEVGKSLSQTYKDQEKGQPH